MTALIGLDWGTSSLRGARLNAHGVVLEERAFARGILSVEAGGFGAVFDACFGDWMAQMKASGTEPLCLISGMAGSQQGWIEAPYCACPAGLAEVAAQLQWVDAQRGIAIVPGLRCETAGVPDVMRGEETQVFGALQLLVSRGALGALGALSAPGSSVGQDTSDTHLFVLPGTHSKWVTVQSGRIEHFTTLMTGEVYALLRRHSILARTLPAEDGDLHDAACGAAFDAGVALALSGGRGGSLLHHAFSVRSLALFGKLPAAQAPSYLSGLVIGEELRSRQLVGAEQVVLVGDPALTERYRRALTQCGVQAQSLGAQATWRGLHDLARHVVRPSR